MITQKRRIGDVGEELACRFLQENGYAIVERNFSCKFGEIDIIAKKGNSLVFVEVKTAHKGSLLFAQENITYNKIRKFTKAVTVYLVTRRISSNQQWQMDAILVKLESASGTSEITRIENINIS